jgi:hypothetical protein
MYAPEECDPWGNACNNPAPSPDGGGGGLAVECNQNADCTANGMSGAVCCLVGAHPAADAGCGYPKYSGGDSIKCEMGTACAAGETQVCSSQGDCPSGTTCTAGKWKILQVGYCL